MNSIYAPIHRAVCIVAGQCDGAVDQDGQGFNGGDTAFGKSLAQQLNWTPKQAAAAKKMILRYPRQVGEALIAEIKAIDLEAALPAAPSANGGVASNVATNAPVLSGPLDVEKLLPWGEPTSVYTRNGERMVRKADIPEGSPFWQAWREQKEALKTAGVTIYKNEKRGVWEATLWPKRGSEQAPTAPVVAQEAEVPDWVLAKLIHYQRDGCKRLASSLKTFGYALDASQMGCGKTYMALGAAAALGLKVAVVCPKAVKTGWRRAAAHFGMADIFVENYEQYRLGKTPFATATRVPRLKKDGTPQLHKTTKKPIVDVVFKWIVPDDTVVIWDECHRAGAQNSQNADALIACVDSGAKRMLLSGTAADSPLAMKGIGYALGLFPKASHWFKWACQAGCVKGNYGVEFVRWMGNTPQDKQRRAVEQQKHMKSIHAQIFGKGKGNRLCKDLISDFPEVAFYPELIDFENSAEIQQAYDDMKEALSHLDEVEKKDRQGIILTEQLRARQRVEILKTPTLAKVVNDAVSEGMSVAVFVNFDKTVDDLSSLLKTDCVVRGGQSEEERTANIDRFQRGDFPRLALVCPTFSAKDILQALDRVHRAVDKAAKPQWSDDCARVIVCNIKAGGIGISLHHLGGAKCVQKVIFAADTTEEDACAAVERKAANISLLNDGDLMAGLTILEPEKELAYA